ncbi:MAG: ABC transporter substrate-binding protein [Desulfobacterales bacterium]|nr:ABC transporter substrate-binding protein [Desulfobacterales bacterium]
MKNRFVQYHLVLTLIISLILPLPGTAAEKLTLMLDWFPNVDHLPIYLAREAGYFEDHHVEVEILTPSDTSDALKLVAAGQVDLAVSYQPQTIIAAAQGLDIRAVTPLVVHPLTTLLFLDESIKTPSDLSGKNIGYTVPGLMDVMLKAFADINGVRDYTPVNVGFTILPALVSNQVDAVMGPFKTYETVGMKQHGYAARYFELEKYGIPDYEELIFVAGTRTLEEKDEAIQGFVTAIKIALAEARSKPAESLAVYLAAVPEADKTIETQAFELTRPYFAGTEGHNTDHWQAFADFALKYGLIPAPVDAAALIHTWE